MNRHIVSLFILISFFNSFVLSDVLDCPQIQSLIGQYFKGKVATNMMCISYFESSWNTDAGSSSTAIGLFQIQPEHCGEICASCTNPNQLFDPNANTQCASDLFVATGYKSWSVISKCEGWRQCVSNSTSSSSSGDSGTITSGGSASGQSGSYSGGVSSSDTSGGQSSGNNSGVYSGGLDNSNDDSTSGGGYSTDSSGATSAIYSGHQTGKTSNQDTGFTGYRTAAAHASSSGFSDGGLFKKLKKQRSNRISMQK
ncbi:hypothetical protein DLAC_11681 [Tieghemostelium lacteum]|uniref:Transglycosylase SLT domain-containing protein n=1 Tax=Tieghemostelium lacteum TaxID=361077 RepID=A0A151ZDB4_TIELA|nr:hypothetical protein DLAC_11681 [Tieghemostelium lacteum]|eukprot:KYQ91943.1 hypothetical protein DLAC_11681 [Tieghemostelium lacteum]